MPYVLKRRYSYIRGETMEKLILLIVFTLLLVASVHSNLNTAFVPCMTPKLQNPNNSLHYEWLHPWSNKSVGHNDDAKSRLSVTDNGTLLIKQFTYEDWGKYVCRLLDGDTVLEEIVVDVTDKYIVVSDAERPLEECPSWACIQSEKCTNHDQRICPEAGDVCCPRMKEEDKHRCRHFLGECMETCHVTVRATRADDCPENTTCCILV